MKTRAFNRLRPELDILCVHGTICAHDTVHLGAVLFYRYSVIYLRTVCY